MDEANKEVLQSWLNDWRSVYAHMTETELLALVGKQATVETDDGKISQIIDVVGYGMEIIAGVTFGEEAVVRSSLIGINGSAYPLKRGMAVSVGGQVLHAL